MLRCRVCRGVTSLRNTYDNRVGSALRSSRVCPSFTKSRLSVHSGLLAAVIVVRVAYTRLLVNLRVFLLAEWTDF